MPKWCDVYHKMWRSHTPLGESVTIGNANIICRRQTSLKKSPLSVDKSDFFVGRGSRIRLLRTLFAWRPNATHSVPVCAPFCYKTVHRTVLFNAKTLLGFKSYFWKTKKVTHSDNLFSLAGAVGFEPTTHGFGDTVKAKRPCRNSAVSSRLWHSLFWT